MVNGKEPDDREPTFSFGTRELREAQRAEPLALIEPPAKPDAKSVVKAVSAAGGFDPYNTSGSFDRRKHWERVGRR